MGDRCSCTLRVFGTTTSDLWADVRVALDHFGIDEEFEDNEFNFLGVNYAELDTPVAAALEAAGLSYFWLNGAGDEYPAGLLVFDQGRKKQREFHCDDYTILMPMSEVALVDEYQSWQTWLHQKVTTPLIITP